MVAWDGRHAGDFSRALVEVCLVYADSVGPKSPGNVGLPEIAKGGCKV